MGMLVNSEESDEMPHYIVSALFRLKHDIGADECLTRQKIKHSIQ